MLNNQRSALFQEIEKQENRLQAAENQNIWIDLNDSNDGWFDSQSDSSVKDVLVNEKVKV